ncbi:MAG: long-chain fatty acid--CoA ligase [Nitrososphaerota archaeon]|nr:long-chain fatty acid--CoA ligase [Nitrososphaerota archaeon]
MSDLPKPRRSEERPWMKMWPKEVPAHLEYPEETLADLLSKMARKQPEAVQFVFMGREITFHETDSVVDRLASSFQRLGLKKGGRVALVLPNCPQFAFSYYATLRAGGVVVPVNPLYTEGELKAELVDSGAELVVALDIFYDMVARAAKGTEVRHVVATNVADYMPPLKARLGRLLGKVPSAGVPADAGRFGRLVAEGGSPERVAVDVYRDPAIFMYTGGTTGTPKAAMLSNMNLVSNCIMVTVWGGLSSEDCVLAAIPWFHVYGMTVALNASITAGLKVVALPRFSVKDTFEAVRRYRPTTFPGVFSMYIALMASPLFREYKAEFGRLRSCLSGAAPLPIEVAKSWTEATGSLLAEGYGLSEASPVTHANPLRDNSKVRLGSIGFPMPDTDARVVDMQTGKELGPGEHGELIIKGPQVGLGYWNRKEDTEATFRDGWLHTGDIAYMDEDGYFYIVDRKKDMINVGGLKVWPREVEEVAYGHEAVRMAAAVGVHDDFHGESPKLFVVLKEGYRGKVSEADMISFMKGKLAPYKVPKFVEFKDELPTTLVGKVLRRKLRE